MTYLPDAHRPATDDDLDGCWAGGNRACGAPAEEPSGLCPDHLAEITSGDRRQEPESCASCGLCHRMESCRPMTFATSLAEFQDVINEAIHEMVAEMEPAVRSILVHVGALPDPEAAEPAAGMEATFWIEDEGEHLDDETLRRALDELRDGPTPPASWAQRRRVERALGIEDEA